MPEVRITPGENIQTVVDQHPQGTTYILLAGVHRMQAITPKDGDIFQGEGDQTILSGAKVLRGWQKVGNRWWVGDQTQQGEVPVPPDQCCLPGYELTAHPEDVFFNNQIKRHVPLDQVGPGSWHFDYQNHRIYVGDDPTKRRVETSVTPYLFNRSGASDVTIRDLTVEKYAAPTATAALGLGASNLGGYRWTAQRVRTRWNHGAGIAVDAYAAVLDCSMIENVNFGMVGAGWNITIAGCYFAYNNCMGKTRTTAGYNSYWGAGASKWVYTTDLTVRNCISVGNWGPGLWTDINNIRTRYLGNRVEDNATLGIFHEISYQAWIEGNVCTRNGWADIWPGWATGAGICVSGSPDVEVHHNTCTDNMQGITALDDHRGTGTQGPWTVRNLHVHDNLVENTYPPDPYRGYNGGIDTQGTEMFEPISRNRWERNWYAYAPGYYWNGQNTDWAGWQGYGQDLEGRVLRTAPGIGGIAGMAAKRSRDESLGEPA